MRYNNVAVETFACTLPDEIVTSAEIESRLEPLYRRLKLPEGRLELMSGIAERRFWPRDTLPGTVSAETAARAIAQADIDPADIGLVVHGSVCRDYLEPATASGVHGRLGLSPDCLVYDVSNACLGLLNGVVQAANMIELGQVRAALVVGTESGRGLVETTIAHLNAATSLSRQDIKQAVASLTIGSASAAIVIVHRDISRRGNRLLGGVGRANTRFSHLCRSDRDDSGGDSMNPLMWTDSETLMQEGIATAKEAFDRFLAELGWQPQDINKTFCHQVGKMHHRLLFQSLGLDQQIDFSTYAFLGNTGAAALASTAALGIEQGHLAAGDKVALMGIGSGINVVMLGLEWQQ